MCQEVYLTMNKKLIAIAVAAAVAAPMAAQADITAYGRINNALEFSDNDATGADSTTDISAVASRFGFKGEGKISDNLTARARYEFATTTDKEQANLADLRLGTVGLAGGFGSIDVGNQWSAFYNVIGAELDPTYTVGGKLYGKAGGAYRASNTVKYANKFGPTSLELDVRLNGSNEDDSVAEALAGDGFGVGLMFNVGENFDVGLAFDSEDRDDKSNETDRTGVVVKGSFGNVTASLGWQNVDSVTNSTDDLGVSKTTTSDNDHIQAHVNIGLSDKTSLLLGYGQVDTGGNEPSALTAGVYHKLGGGMRLWAEAVAFDGDLDAATDDTTAADLTRVLLGMRVDF